MIFSFFRRSKNTVGLALSGGAARGIAHVGVLLGFESYGFPIDSIYGTSVGAIIGGLYCGGINAQSLVSIVEKTTVKDFITFKLSRSALFSSESIEQFVERYIGQITFSELKCPFAAVATNLKTGQPEWFDQGDMPVSQAIRASASIPGIFTPTLVHNTEYVDGSLTCHLASKDNMHTDKVIGVNVIPSEPLTTAPTSLYAIVDRSSDCAINRMVALQRDKFDILLTPIKGQYSSINLSQKQELIEYGFQCVKEQRGRIEEWLK